MPSASSSSSKPAVEIEADLARKILRIHFHGVVTAEHVSARIEQVTDLLSNMGPGFSLVTDLTHLEQMEIDTVRDITRMMDLYLKAGVKQIVRVIPDPDKDIGFHLLSMTHYRGRVPISTYASLAEAEQVLEP